MRILVLCAGLAGLAAAGPGFARADEPVVNSIGMTLVPIPAGEFLRGSSESGEDRRPDESPQRPIRITRPFHLGAYEVTQAEYWEVMGANPSFFSPEGPGREAVEGLDTDRFPAEEVRWVDAIEFCRRLSQRPEEKRAGRVYRLPTEAEWEYACRAGTETEFHFGDSLSAAEANFNGRYPHGDGQEGPFLARTTAVGSYPPNAFGLYDMHGNVWEWCLDWYAADSYRASPREDPRGPTSGTARVIRGGCWYSDGRDCRSAFRNAEMPTGIFYVMGFRVVMTDAESALDLEAFVAETTSPSAAETPEGAVVDHGARREDLLAVGGEDWPQWRGPRGDGSWRGPKLPERWSDTGPRLCWRQPVGPGYSGVAAAEGRVLTQDRQTEPNEIERVLCFDGATGAALWSYQYAVDYGSLPYGNGPRGTPTVSDGRVYTLGAMGHLHCLDLATGQRIWSRDVVGEWQAEPPLWGFSASPVVFEDLLIVHAGAPPDACLVALDRRTGQEVWRNLPDQAGYATPAVIEHAGRRQLLCWTPRQVHGLEPATGERLWSVPFEVVHGTSIARPVFHRGIVLVSGYWEGSIAVQLGDRADEASLLWKDHRNLRALMAQPLAREGYGYLLDKRHGLTCFEIETGRKLWDDENRMTPKGRNPQATLVWAGDEDRAIVLNSDGELILARLNPQGYHEQSRAPIIGATWAHPAYAWGRVFARSDSELVCVSLLEANPME